MSRPSIEQYTDIPAWHDPGNNEDKVAGQNEGVPLVRGHEQQFESTVAAESGGAGVGVVHAENYPMDENILNFTAEAQRNSSAIVEDDGPEYPERSTEELLAPPDFKPFFTLIENPETGDHHHPVVHYIFSDDDPEMLTSATLEAIDTPSSGGQPGAQDGEQRFVLLDIAGDGKTVVSASSLTSTWQSVKTTVTQAPSWGEDAQNNERGLLLKISGQEAGQGNSGKARKAQSGQDATLDDLILKLGERLKGLKEVLGPITYDGVENAKTE